MVFHYGRSAWDSHEFKASWRSRGASEDCVHGDVPLFKEPFGDVDTIPVSVAPGAEFTRGGIHLCCELQLLDPQFEFSGEYGGTRNRTPPIGISAFAIKTWESRYRHKPDHTPRWVTVQRNHGGVVCGTRSVVGQRGLLHCYNPAHGNQYH